MSVKFAFKGQKKWSSWKGLCSVRQRLIDPSSVEPWLLLCEACRRDGTVCVWSSRCHLLAPTDTYRTRGLFLQDLSKGYSNMFKQ